MRVLVTGGAGFIGRRLTQALLNDDHDVVILDNLWRASADALPDGAVFIHGDIRDRDTVERAVRGCDHVYHLAAQSNVMGAVTDVDYSFTTNVVGTFNVLHCSAQEGVEKVIFASSREVYGDPQYIPVAENHPLAAKNAYGASKVAGEAYCQAFQTTHGLQSSILRLANVYGTGDQGRVIPLWLERAARGERLELYGGEQVLDFVPVSLAVRALMRASRLTRGAPPINVGSGRGVALRELAERIAQLPGAHVRVDVRPARTVEVTRFVARVDQMRAVLGLEPPTDPLAELEAQWEACLRSSDVAATNRAPSLATFPSPSLVP